LLITENEIQNVLIDFLELPLKLLKTKVRNRGSHFFIDIILDNFEHKYGSVSVNDCEAVSRHLGDHLESSKPGINYTLQVSSAGAERELFLPEDLKRFQGIPMRLSYTNSEEETLKEGIFEVVEFQEDEVMLNIFTKKKQKSSITVKVKDIKKGNLYLDI
jgi:ribosome maturation factor RimP